MQQNKKFAIHTLGCKLNFAESATIARSLEQAGYDRTDFKGEADIYVINTCTVTGNAEKDFRQLVRGIRRRSPGAYIAAVGCFAQLKPDQVGSIEGVDLVLGTNEKFNILRYLDDLNKTAGPQIHSCLSEQLEQCIGSYSLADRTRAFLKVQDGCDYSCTYCTIPKARGKSRSQDMQGIVRNAGEIAAHGIREIVLTGVNIGDYGRGLPEKTDFFALMKELERIDGIERIRISSIEPNLITDQMIRHIAQGGKFVPHFHIPLQSGCDNVLKAMKRRYLRQLYAEKVVAIKSLMPDACIGADVIVGFPTETDEDFSDTCNFIRGLDLSYLHVFTYSEREDTPAAQMEISVPMDVRHTRSKALHALSQEKKEAFYRSQMGQERPVLFESNEKDGYIWGFTDNYVRVHLPYDQKLANTVQIVRLTPQNTNILPQEEAE